MKRLILSVLWLGVFVVTTGQTAPIDDARYKGVAWLITHQSGDGSWRGAPGLEVAETAAAIEALVNAGITQGDTFATGVAWLQNHQADSADALSRQIIALYKAGRDTSGLMTRLIALRNDTDRSWGAYDHYSGSFPDTSLAMDAIKTTVTPYADAGYGIGFIAGKQNSNGGWPYYKDPLSTLPSKIIPTAHNLLTLNRYKLVYNVTANLSNGIAWLKTQQIIPSGGFGEGTGTVLETALAYRALVAELGSADPAAVNAQSFLLAQQQVNGSWGTNDALLTTLTLAALPAAALPDTDKDGLPDGVETPALLGTNPNVADGHRLRKGNGQSVAGVTAPSLMLQAVLNQPYAMTLAPSEGTPPHTWMLTSGELPDGLSLDSNTGQISGIPTTLGPFNFIYLVTDTNTQESVTSQIEVLANSGSTQVPALPDGAMILMALLLILTMGHLERRRSLDLR